MSLVFDKDVVCVFFFFWYLSVINCSQSSHVSSLNQSLCFLLDTLLIHYQNCCHKIYFLSFYDSIHLLIFVALLMYDLHLRFASFYSLKHLQLQTAPQYSRQRAMKWGIFTYKHRKYSNPNQNHWGTRIKHSKADSAGEQKPWKAATACLSRARQSPVREGPARSGQPRCLLVRAAGQSGVVVPN